MNYEFLYVHLPFCEVICHYCDFYKVRAKSARHEELFAALFRELAIYRSNLKQPLKTVYFGGGTPGITPPALLKSFLQELAPLINTETEITLEVNPNNVSEAAVSAWKDAGINRLSMGIQSLRDDLLKKMGRTHSAANAKAALRICIDKIPNVTGDLIYAIPGQSITDPAEDAAILLDLGLKHLSAYNLTLREKHFMYSKILPGDEAFEQVLHLANETERRGLRHYEISAFSLPGYESKHNQNYWQGGPYLALGPSAHGYDGERRRWKNIADWEKYVATLNQGELALESEEILSPEQLIMERIFTELRTEKGIDLNFLNTRWGVDIAEKHKAFVDELSKQGLGEIRDGHLALTFRGRMLGDEIAKKLI